MSSDLETPVNLGEHANRTRKARAVADTLAAVPVTAGFAERTGTRVFHPPNVAADTVRADADPADATVVELAARNAWAHTHPNDRPVKTWTDCSRTTWAETVRIMRRREHTPARPHAVPADPFADLIPAS